MVEVLALPGSEVKLQGHGASSVLALIQWLETTGRNVEVEHTGSGAQRAQLNAHKLQVPCDYISCTFKTCFAHARQAARKLDSRNTRAAIVACWPQTQLQCGCARESACVCIVVGPRGVIVHAFAFVVA